MGKTKLKLRLANKHVLAWDPETNITWEGEREIESEVTKFVAKAMAKGVLIEAKEKDDKDKDKK